MNDCEFIGHAQRAYEEGVWQQALQHYRDAETAGAALSAPDLERMAEASWLLGEPADAIFGRAIDGYVAADRPHDAVRTAIALADYHALLGEFAAAMAWARRADRLIEGAPPGPGHARLAILHGFLAVMSGKVGPALEHVERGYELARAHHDEDAEALALSRRARLLLRLGRIEEAMADADEAMLLVHRGKTMSVHGAMIYCSTIDLCRDLGDFERALEWTEAAARWTTERQICGFPGLCRVHRAELLRLQGEHAQAVVEIRSALELFERHRFRHGIAEAMAELGQHHLEMGDLDAAREAFSKAEALGHDCQPGSAELAMREGKAQQARAMLETALDDQRDNRLGRAHLLPSYVAACLDLDDLPAARAAAEELRQTARTMGTVGLQASAATASARVHLATRDTSEAIAAARAATKAWCLVGACYELAQARDLLARAYEAAGDSVRAEVERERFRTTQQALSSAATVVAADSGEVTGKGPASAAVPRPLRESVPIREGVILEGKIAIGSVLGIGGMGIVHAGKHLVTGRDVAVKVLNRRSCGGTPNCERLLHEAKACGRIRHANVVDIYDAGMHGEEPYIVMERLEGRTLEDLLAERQVLPVSDALAICEQAALGVAAAHEAGVVHRDLKPANIFIGDSGVKVLDFGISKQPDGVGTNPGQLMGTPFYMAPEQILRAESVDGRTDVYALGVVLFEMLAGRPPFVSDAVPALLFAITYGPEPDLSAAAPETPAEVVALVHRALARDPDARFRSATALSQAIAGLTSPS